MIDFHLIISDFSTEPVHSEHGARSNNSEVILATQMRSYEPLPSIR